METKVAFENLKVVNIEATNKCNLRCVSCGDNKTRTAGFISLELCEKLANQCKDKELRLFMSGEPLLHPSIDELIKICRKHSDTVVLHTNATLLDAQTGEKLIKANLTRLSISFDGITKNEYESNRRGAKFESVTENIKTFLKMNNGRIAVAIQRIIPYNSEEKADLSTFFPGASSYPVIYRHSWDIKGLIPGVKPASFYASQCYFLWNYFSILWDGRANLCCADIGGREIIGDANTETIENLWNCKKLMHVRSCMIKRIKTSAICDGCERYGI